MFTNPSYTHTSPSTHIPAVQYSSTGPRDTPTTGHPPKSTTGGEERIYHVLAAEGERAEGDYQEIDHEEGEGVYHVLGEEEGVPCAR